MKMKIAFPLLTLCAAASSAHAQTPTRLSPDHTLYQGRVSEFAPIRVHRYVNYNMYLKVDSDSARRLQGEDRVRFYRNAMKTEAVQLSKGAYLIETPYLYETFTVGDNGKVDGPVTIENKRNNTVAEALVTDGMATQFSTRKDGVLRSRGFFKDSVYHTRELYPSGKVEAEEIRYLKKGADFDKSVRKDYYKSGQLVSVRDERTKTFVGYYENGKKERETDDLKDSGTYYDKNGKPSWRYYPKGDYRCKENYTDGVLTTKTCEGPKDRKYDYYKAGKLDRTEVYNLQTGKTTVYDAKGKLLTAPSISDKVPSIGR